VLRSRHWIRTAASTEPVTLPEARQQLRIDHTEDNEDIANMIVEARLDCETRLGDVSLIDATCIDYFNVFADEMELHWSPVDSITSIAYTDTAGTSQTLSSATYELGERHGIGIVRLKYGQTWPNVRDHPDIVVVTYKAGYGAAASDVPEGIKRWIKARIAWLYENRDGEQFPWNLDALLTPHGTARVIG